MRNFLWRSIVFLVLVGCSNDNSHKMNISGTVRGLKKGTLFLQKFEDTLLVTVDSAIVDGNSNFKFSEIVESPEIYYLYVQLKDGSLQDDRIAFFAENGDLNITTNLQNFGNAARISGSKNDSLLREYDKLKQRYVSKNLELIEQKLKLGKGEKESVIADLDTKQQNLLSNKYLTTVNFALNHKDLEIAPYLMLNEVYDVNIKYLDTVYRTLSPKIKDSKYGKELESYIIIRKEKDTLL
ncbi:MAG: DUF4369 domain-containing protein [Aequorivita sp.]